jgi:5S rRNA maturation endonuclease (ribonuclease M5)
MLIDQKVKNILKQYSNVYKETSGGKEIQIFCPYCGDAFRKNNPRWGHLYISTDTGLFYCHRCNEKGTLYKLLLDLGVDDEEVLSKLRKYFKVHKQISSKEIRNIDFITNSIEKFNEKISKVDYYELWYKYTDEYNYLVNRIDVEDLDLFYYYRLTPDNNSIVFNDYEFNEILRRLIKSKHKRYKKVQDKYYSIYKTEYNILIAEGPFDIINIDLYLNYDAFTKIAIGGKNYISALTELYLYTNIKNLIIMVDNDIDVNKFYKYIIKQIHRYEIHVENIEIYQNSVGKDFSEKIILLKE